ncbi:TPA: hypothetical protein I8654_003113 [Morganella morganii]|nr:hypothetical protein [Morganella morganii]
MVNKDIITHLQLTGFVMSEDLVIEIAAKLIDAINNISKEENILNTWAPPIAVIIASIITSYAMLKQANKTYQGMVEQANKTYQGMVEQTNKTYQGMVEQTNKTIEHSDFLFLSEKKEELYIYLDVIKNEIMNEYKTLRHYDPENEPSDTSNIRESIRKKLLQNMTEQKTKNKINMVISLYLQDVDIYKLKFNTLYDEFSHECKECYSTVVDFNFPYQKLNLSKLTTTKNELITAIQQMQNKVIDIKR